MLKNLPISADVVMDMIIKTNTKLICANGHAIGSACVVCADSVLPWTSTEASSIVVLLIRKSIVMSFAVKGR